ncbi:MAG: LLM class flavin-dependent oxidoreductase [Chloroflexi bacterium]|nr:LLM class flavin-dependent oxidoreductase [Chloroflexota bacterium]
MPANSPPRVRFAVRIHQGGYSYEDLRKVWVEADRLGYYSASLYDLLNVPTLECWTTLSALAAETQRIRLVPLVLANLYRHPALLARMAATLDVISGGRLELGIGAGGGETDHQASGLSFPSTRVRVAILEEAVEVITRLWSGRPVSFEGHYYRLENAVCDPVPLQKPRPPVLIGGHGERHLLGAVARHADIANMRFDMSLEDHRKARRVLEGHCLEVGRDPSEIDVSHNATVLIARDQTSLDAMLSQAAAGRRSLGNAIVGTPDQCTAQLRRYVDAGTSYFFLLFPHPIDLGQLRLFAQRVMPLFSD